MDIEFYFFSKWYVGNIIYIPLSCKSTWPWPWVHVFASNTDLASELLTSSDFFFFADLGTECIKSG